MGGRQSRDIMEYATTVGRNEILALMMAFPTAQRYCTYYNNTLTTCSCTVTDAARALTYLHG